MKTVSQFWDWLDRNDDRTFWELFERVYETAPPALRDAMSRHADYLIGAADSALHRAETNFGC